MKRRALLLAGGINHSYCEVRYRNDLRAFHDALVGDLGFSRDDVRVSFADGEDPALAAVTSNLHGATPGDVDAALAWLVADLAADDLVLLVASNHGGPEGLCLWGSDTWLTPERLDAALANCPAAKVMVFGQCHAGVFGDLTLDRAVICCACDRDQSSYAREPEPPDEAHDYDEFLYHFVAALAGRYPDGASFEGVAASTVAEAFAYAKRCDAESEETPTLFDRGGLASVLSLRPAAS